MKSLTILLLTLILLFSFPGCGRTEPTSTAPSKLESTEPSPPTP